MERKLFVTILNSVGSIILPNVFHQPMKATLQPLPLPKDTLSFMRKIKKLYIQDQTKCQGLTCCYFPVEGCSVLIFMKVNLVQMFKA